MSNVAPGAYVILAKTDVFANGTGSGIVQCRVNAGSDSDFANPLIGDNATPPESVFEATLEANVVHQFTGSGTIDMDCTNNGPLDLTVSAPADQDHRHQGRRHHQQRGGNRLRSAP